MPAVFLLQKAGDERIHPSLAVKMVGILQDKRVDQHQLDKAGCAVRVESYPPRHSLQA